MSNNNDQITEPKRVRDFANFFKSYMSISSIVTAALPIPITSFKLIPMYDAHTTILSVYTSMFCFLLLGYIFYIRHDLARYMFNIENHLEYTMANSSKKVGINDEKETSEELGEGEHARTGLIAVLTVRQLVYVRFMKALPFFLIIFSMSFLFLYHYHLDNSISMSINSISMSSSLYEEEVRYISPWDEEVVLSETPLSAINISYRLIFSYLGIFLSAVSAFILMAIKEYLQDLLGISEEELIYGESF